MILYFTGTGNSGYVARRIGAAIGEGPVDLLEKIKAKDHSELRSETPWIICSPTYAWQLPRILRDWLINTPLNGSKDVYFVLTCGGSSGGAERYAEKICAEKGMDFHGLAQIVMPENYIAMFNAPQADSAAKIVDKAEPKIDEAIEIIKGGRDFPRKSGVLGFILSALVNKSFYKYAIDDKKFVVSDACVSCGLCAKNCPAGSIVMKDGKPQWNGGCTHCMACICHCPESAIEYGKASVGKPRYTCPK